MASPDPVHSMTGFARAEGAVEGYRWTWEVKSVNARNLDLRFRLPPGSDPVEAHARGVAQKRFARGNISVQLGLARPDRARRVRVNREALEQMTALADEVRTVTAGPPATPEGLLALPGVIEPLEEEESEESRDIRNQALIASLEKAFDDLAKSRGEEGRQLTAVMGERLAEIERHCAEAEACAEARPEAIQARLRQQLDLLLAADNPVSEDRLAQEVALIAAKGDVREELDRLAAHVVAARDLIAAGGAIGRRLDFLCQEFNREANTLCSKSSDIELTRIGLDLKAAVERLREQVQNVE